MDKILNLTQHNASADQLAVGVVDADVKDQPRIKQWLTFDGIPTKELMKRNAIGLTAFAEQYREHDGINTVMIGGAPYFMRHLEDALLKSGFRVLYAFSKRESVDEHQPDGSVKKTFIFKHEGFYEV